MSKGKEFIFNGFIDGFSKCLFTIIPLVLGFGNYIKATSDPVGMRVSFLVSTISLILFYIIELSRASVIMIKLEAFFSCMFLAVSFVLTLWAFQKTYYSRTDLIALIFFAASVLPLISEMVLAFIFIDCGYKKKGNKKPFRDNMLPRSVGNISDGASKV